MMAEEKKRGKKKTSKKGGTQDRAELYGAEQNVAESVNHLDPVNTDCQSEPTTSFSPAHSY